MSESTQNPLGAWQTVTQYGPAVQLPGNLPPGAGLDSMLTLDQFALWVGWSLATAQRKAQDGLIPGVVRDSNGTRIHPRTFLAKQGSAFREAVTVAGK